MPGGVVRPDVDEAGVDDEVEDVPAEADGATAIARARHVEVEGEGLAPVGDTPGDVEVFGPGGRRHGVRPRLGGAFTLFAVSACPAAATGQAERHGDSCSGLAGGATTEGHPPRLIEREVI